MGQSSRSNWEKTGACILAIWCFDYDSGLWAEQDGVANDHVQMCFGALCGEYCVSHLISWEENRGVELIGGQNHPNYDYGK